MTTLFQSLKFISARIEAVKRKEGNEREGLKKKHADEVMFLKVNQSNNSAIRPTCSEKQSTAETATWRHRTEQEINEPLHFYI